MRGLGRNQVLVGARAEQASSMTGFPPVRRKSMLVGDEAGPSRQDDKLLLGALRQQADSE